MELDTLIKILTELREKHGNKKIYIQRQDADWYDDFGVDVDEDGDVFIGF